MKHFEIWVYPREEGQTWTNVSMLSNYLNLFKRRLTMKNKIDYTFLVHSTEG